MNPAHKIMLLEAIAIMITAPLGMTAIYLVHFNLMFSAFIVAACIFIAIAFVEDFNEAKSRGGK